ncbi:zinc-binding dehydrogenase [Streptomyces chiangmaiensis]|uniref:Zinc-binding dehydrogenase n=1 Tax=Streptomyces chiangmaiensis TaxID=766497 RepID=A0ABU7FQ30_9ACTN|nr:zinc-binding dehydrogenase [Streptomyces chiangmaiensis]MED7826197.1 zinc-binding dehydrogenase [Streptomyces chiangmaiensis]
MIRQYGGPDDASDPVRPVRRLRCVAPGGDPQARTPDRPGSGSVDNGRHPSAGRHRAPGKAARRCGQALPAHARQHRRGNGPGARCLRTGGGQPRRDQRRPLRHRRRRHLGRLFQFAMFTQEQINSTNAVLLDLVARKEIAPLVDRIFPLEQAAEAQRHLIEGGPFGRVLLSL